jgi:hypothetical protein
MAAGGSRRRRRGRGGGDGRVGSEDFRDEGEMVTPSGAIPAPPESELAFQPAEIVTVALPLTAFTEPESTPPAGSQVLESADVALPEAEDADASGEPRRRRRRSSALI